jgi:hypothetical protein
MGRYKDRRSPKVLARDFRYTVEMAVPDGGLGRTLDRMYEFHSLREITPYSGDDRHVDGRNIITWLFADPAIALEFGAEFNGTMLVPAKLPHLNTKTSCQS